VAHIDHGKSTLADRFLELTKTVEKRKMHEQYLDTMELERERGITIKLQPVKMFYELNGQKYVLNLIDTPGHVDFSYEVSRSLAAVEGAILLVDASKGIQAQTLANLHLAQQQGLKIIPVLNKIDLPNARTEQVKEELSYLLATEIEDILEVSAKNGTNVEKVLERVIKVVPPPSQNTKYEIRNTNLKALIFDSTFDAYKGVVAFIRVFEGSIKKGDKVMAFATKAKADVLEAGYFSPNLIASDDGMSSGEIGYIATGLKDPGQIRVGDTITNFEIRNSKFEFNPLPGYKEPRPMVFASFFPEKSDRVPWPAKARPGDHSEQDYDILKDALGKLKLTDASLVYEPESSAGLGRGFRLGFLGMLHVEIISERLKREFGLSLIISSPSVEYAVKMQNGEELKIRSASMLPDFSGIKSIAEPIVYLEVLTPVAYMGSVMELMATVRNIYKGTDYLGKETALLKYEMPLSEVITDFYDKLKSVSSGYASMSYEPKDMQEGDLIRLDILIAKDLVEPFSRIVPKEKAYQEGRSMVTKLKEVVPPQMFEVSIQAAIGGKVIASESIRAKKKDVTQHMYGGDITRRMKLWKKQKRGKARMKETGRVNLPQDVFLKMLKR